MAIETVLSKGSIYRFYIHTYINKWKINHDVVYDLKENKIYMLETANLNLIKKEEQLRLMTEIINYGLEKD